MNVLVVSVAGSIASENVAVGLVVAATPVVPSVGVVPVTVGGVESGVLVVKLKLAEVARFPEASLLLTRYWYWVPAVRPLRAIEWLVTSRLSSVVREP